MNTLKNIFFVALVVAISLGVFTLLEDKKTAENILASMAEMVLEETMARVPDEDRSKIALKRDELINKIDERQVSEEQYKTVIARIENLNLSPDSVSAEEVNAILEASIQADPQREKGQTFAVTKAKAEQLQRRIRHIREFEGLVSNIKNDSVRERLVRHAMVTPDNDFQLVFNEDIRQDPKLLENPQVRHFFEGLHQRTWVKLESFSRSPDIRRQAIQFHAPALPANSRVPFVLHVTAGETSSITIDSIMANIPKNLMDTLEWEQLNKDLQNVLEQSEHEAQ